MNLFRKGKTNKLDEYGFDSSLDFNMPDFSDDVKIKKDRSSITNIKDLGKGIASGTKDTLKSPSFIRSVVKKSLPSGFGDTLDLARDINYTIKKVYSESAKEMKPMMADVKRTTKKILPLVEKRIPRSMASKIKEWSESYDDKIKDMSPEEQHNVSLQMQLGEIFSFQSKAALEKENDDNAKSVLKDGIEYSRHQDLTSQLDAMRISLQQLANYKIKLESNYQRKSLELQFRSYFLAQDSLEEQKKHNTLTTTVLEGILKNTGLPDFVKLKTSERLHEAMRNKFIDSASNNLINARGQFLSKVGSNIGKVVKDKVSNFAGNVQSALQAGTMLGEGMEQASSFGGSKAEMAGSFIPGVYEDELADYTAKLIRKVIPRGSEREKKINDIHTSLSYFTENLPQIMTDYSHQYGFNVSERSGKLGKVKGWFDPGGPLSFIGDIIKETTREANRVDNILTGDRAANMQDPAHFSRGASKSITEIIPGYLARIYRELQVIRTGDEKIQLTVYDYNSNRFSEKSTVAKKIFEDITGRKINNSKDSEKRILELKKKKHLNEKEKNELDYLTKSAGISNNDYTKQQVEELLNEIDSDKSLSDEERIILGKYLLSSNLNNRTGSIKRLTDSDSFVGKDVYKYGDKFANLFSNYFGTGQEAKNKQLEFSRKYNKLGAYTTDSRKVIQDYLNTGNRDILEELGIIDIGNDRINTDKLNQYAISDNSEISDLEQGNNKARYKVTNKRKKIKHYLHGGSVHETNLALRNKRDTVPAMLDDGEYVLPADTVNAIGRDKLDALRDATHGSSIQHFAKGGNVSKANSVLEAISKTLLRIEKILNEGININGNRGTSKNIGINDHWWNKSIKDIGSGAYHFGKSSFNKVKNTVDDIIDDIYGKGKNLVGVGYNIGKKLINKGIEEYKSIRDVYIKGELMPRLRAELLKAGEYRDQITGKIIKSYKDIKGAVIDKEGNIILTVEEAKKAFIKSNIGEKLITTLGSVITSAKNTINDLFNGIPGAINTAYKLGSNVANKLYSLTKLPQDVYVKGKPEKPALYAIIMKIPDGYISAVTGKMIKNPGDIDGPVYGPITNGKRDTALTIEDIQAGLVDVNGKPIRTGLAKITGFLKDKFTSGLNYAKKGATFLKNKVTDLAKGIGNVFKNGVHIETGGIHIGSSSVNISSVILKRLTQIRDIVNDNLPDEKRHKFNDNEDHLETLGSKVSNVASKAKSFLKGKWNSLIKRAGGASEALLENGSEMLKVLKERLPKPKKHVIGDVDGSGIREGSYADILRRKKDEAVDKAKNIGSSIKEGGKSAYGLAAAGIGSLWNKVRGKDKEEDKKDGVLDTAEGVVGGEVATKGIKGLWQSAKKLGGKGLLKLGGRALGYAGAAYGAYSAYDNYKKGNYGSAALDAGLSVGTTALTTGGVAGLTTAGTSALGVGGSILSGIGTALASPAVLGALAVAAVVGGGYFLYKHFHKKSLDSFSKVRYAQYGYLPDDKDHVNAVMGLEDKVMPAVSYDKGIAKFDGTKLKVKDIISDFDVKLENKLELDNFINWFNMRFKPVFLTHLTALAAVDPSKKLDDISKLKPEEKKKYFDAAKFPEGPYNVNISPFPSDKKTVADKTVVNKLIEIADAEIKKELDKSKEKKGDTSTWYGSALAAIAGGPIGYLVYKNLTKAEPVEKKPTLNKSKLNDAIKPKIGANGLGSTVGQISVTGVPLSLNSYSSGKLTALEAIRFKSYGLIDLDIEKVKTLVNLERTIAKDLIFAKGNIATWKGSVEKVLDAVGPSFGIASTGAYAYKWISWFNKRFLPIYLNYVTGVCSASNKQNIETGLLALKPQQVLDVATAMFTTKGIWNESDSPWPDYTLNADIKSVDTNVDVLKEATKKAKLDEEKSKAAPTGIKPNKPPYHDPKYDYAPFREVYNKAKNAISNIGEGIFNIGRSIGSGIRNTGEAISNKAAQITGNVSDMFKEAVAAAKAAEAKWGVPAAVTLAQFKLESGNGKHMPPGSNNPFGIKAYGNQPSVAAMTTEHENGVNVRKYQNFRVFNSLAEAFDEHGKLLGTRPQYKRAMAFKDDPNKFADALTGVYATDPAYGTKLKSIIKSLMPLLSGTSADAFANTNKTIPASILSTSDTSKTTTNTDKTTINPIGKFPVSDQAPGVTANIVTPTPVTKPTSAAASTPVSPDIAAASSGFITPKSRDLIAQSQYKKEISSSDSSAINSTLQSSLSVHQSQLEVLNKILNIISSNVIKNANNNSTNNDTNNDTKPKDNTRGAKGKAEEMPKAPVSMTKQQNW